MMECDANVPGKVYLVPGAGCDTCWASTSCWWTSSWADIDPQRVSHQLLSLWSLKKKKKSYIWMLHIESPFCSFLISIPFSHSIPSSFHLLTSLLPKYWAPTTMLSCIWRSIFFMVVINISSLGSTKQASVCCVEIQKLKLKGTDFPFVALIYKLQVWQD